MARAKGSRKESEPFCYYWRHMPAGSKKVAASPIDALLEVLQHELQIPRVTQLIGELGLEGASVSRVRHRNGDLPHQWLLRAAVYSGIPYEKLCEVVGEEPQYWPHPKAWKPVAA